MPLKLPEGMSSRKRRPNWTDQECLLLAQLMLERKDVIKGKCSSGVSLQAKRQAWEEIAQSINDAFPQFQRTVSDCNKKWENLLAKSREEIKRQRRQEGSEGSAAEQFSTVTQVVMSVVNLSDILQQDREDASISELMEAHQNSDEGSEHRIDARYSNQHPQRELELPTYPDPSTSPAEQKMADFPKTFAVHFSTHHAAGVAAAAEHRDAFRPSSSSAPPAAHCTTLQERVDLEMSVLRRQEAVLRLQEEYYTLKIQLMKRQTETLSKD
ncbi:myb/SANT-like DNA-binding domain-containing protein 4 [Clinocottus analis]|uniref:myb/SANT-like DNA-binding domain-containing protein 4 n=1 Tax=Clinocottus analis TaxID=304258 RepID=UPI0035C1CE67